jgi:hypothetical protein
LLLRLIILFALLYVLWCALRAHFRSRGAKPRTSDRGAEQVEEMVLDPQCQSYVPKAEAVQKAGKYFCSQECARLYLAR